LHGAAESNAATCDAGGGRDRGCDRLGRTIEARGTGTIEINFGDACESSLDIDQPLAREVDGDAQSCQGVLLAERV
jgi:hypothetical protein